MDQITAERVDIALLTRTAFDEAAAYTYAMLSGIATYLIRDVLSRPVTCLRQQVGLSGGTVERRKAPRE